MISKYFNSAICTFGAVIWAAIARQFVPDTNLGVAIVLVPSVILAGAGAYLFGVFRMPGPRD